MSSITPRKLGHGTFLTCSLLLAGCSMVQSIGTFLADVGTPKTSLTQISIVTRGDANGTTATAVDIVFVYSDKVVELLPKSALGWFTGREELSANLRQHIDVTPIEIPPTYMLDRVLLPERHSNAVKVIAYANYLDKKGLEPIDLTNFVRPLLILEEKSINYSEQD